MRVALNVLLHLGGVGGRDKKAAAARPRRAAGIVEHLVRQSAGQGQVGGAAPVVERLRAGAVDVGRLVPADPEVVLTGLRGVELILLIAVADVFRPRIELVDAVPAAGRCPASKKRSGRDRAVLVVFGKTLAAQCGDALALRVI